MYSVHNSGQVEGRSLDKVNENTALMVNCSLGRSGKKKKGHGHDTAKLVLWLVCSESPFTYVRLQTREYHVLDICYFHVLCCSSFLIQYIT